MAPTTSIAGIKRPVAAADKEWATEQLTKLGRFTGMRWILSTEPAEVLPFKTYEAVTVSPGFAAAQDKLSYFVAQMKLSNEEQQGIEKATVGQSKNPLWSSYRHNRITASRFGLVLAAIRRHSFPPSLFKTLRGEYTKIAGAKAIDWGISHEDRGIEQYSQVTGYPVQRRGLFLPTSGLLGASPDGSISDDHIGVVKCPWVATNTSIAEVAENKHFFLTVDEVTGPFKLKHSHTYFDQIQGNLHLIGASRCDSVVWTPTELAIIPVIKDPAWVPNTDQELNNQDPQNEFYLDDPAKDSFLFNILNKSLFVGLTISV
uniref:uncharacterized protein n=1 Tax=Myxine glutinosa TaxID=7769 RepID=UPI00358EFCAA